MKKLLSILLSAVLILSAFTALAAEDATQTMTITVDYINIFVNGQQVWMHNFVHEGTTYIGIRDAGNAFGYDVTWDDETRTANFSYSGKMSPITEIPTTEHYFAEINALVDYATITIDGVYMQARNFVYNGTTYVALRDIGSLFNYVVEWDEETHSAKLGKLALDYSKISGTINGISIPDYLIKVIGQNSLLSAKSLDEVYSAIQEEALAYAFFEEAKSKYNLEITQEDEKLIDSVITDSINTNFGGKEIFEIILAQSGLTYDEYIKYFEATMAHELLYEKLCDKISNDPSIKTEDEKVNLELYNANASTFALPTVRVKHILIPTIDTSTGIALSDKEKSDASAKASALYTQITRKKANFETLISQNNNDPGMPEEGYYVYEGSGMVKEFEEASLKLKVNQVSPVIETSYGYHIIKAYEEFDSIPFEALYAFNPENYISTLISTWIDVADIQFTW